MKETLRWNPTIEWNIEENKADSVCIINFLRSGRVVLKLDAPQELCQFVSDRAKEREFDGDNPRFAKFIALLKSRKIFITSASNRVVVRLFSDCEKTLCTWELSAEKDLGLDILVGDEVSLLTNYTSFLSTRAPTTLMGCLKIRADRLDLGPIRFPHEAQAPTTRSKNPLHYPCFVERFESAAHAVRDLLDECLNTPRWYSLTTKGFRKSWNFKEAHSLYHQESSYVATPKDCAQLVFFQSQIENGVGSGGGVSETAADAEFQASCEAWERFCLARPDLAHRIDDNGITTIINQNGIHFDFLRSLTSPIANTSPYCLAHSINLQEQYFVPTEWVYFNSKTSPTNTNGTAFGSIFEEACSSARLEIIERHHLLSAYLGLSKAQEIKIELNLHQSAANFLQDNKRTVRFYHIGTGNHASVVVCIVSSSTPPYASMGAAARFSMRDAAQKALFEALSVDLLWSTKIGQLGPRQFVATGKGLSERSASLIGLEEGGWVWAAMRDAGDMLHELFHTGTPTVCDLKEEAFIAIDIGENVVTHGSVVKLLHPDALPLPSYYSHTLTLCDLLAVKHPLPVPMT